MKSKGPFEAQSGGCLTFDETNTSCMNNLASKFKCGNKGDLVENQSRLTP